MLWMKFSTLENSFPSTIELSVKSPIASFSDKSLNISIQKRYQLSSLRIVTITKNVFFYPVKCFGNLLYPKFLHAWINSLILSPKYI